jgi:SAM-dependent methyltransferase
MAGEVVNPFVGAAVAARYARARPQLHHRVVALLRKRLPPPRLALDLACGTGLSTRPLSSFAESVIGVDVSEDMLDWARRTGNAMLVAGRIEELPFPGASFDFASIASAIHWIAPEGLEEIRRVLAPGAPLVVYDVWFPGEIVGVESFSPWLHTVCGARYLDVPKHTSNLDRLQDAGFDRELGMELREPVPMTLDHLAEYIMTHSERIFAVEAGSETVRQQRDFLRGGLQPFFDGVRDRQVSFGIDLRIYRSR